MKRAYIKGYTAYVRGDKGVSDCPYRYKQDRRERQWASGFIDAMIDESVAGKFKRRWK